MCERQSKLESDYSAYIRGPLGTLLFVAATDNMLEMRRIVLETAPNQDDNMACLRALVAAYPETFDNCRSSALLSLGWYIIQEYGPPIVRELHELLPNCLTLSSRYGGTILHLCAEDSTPETVKAILEVEPKLASIKCILDSTLALHHCSSAEMVYLLVNAYPEALNRGDGYSGTPLHYAVYTLRIDVVEALLKCGAHTNIKNNDGDTPIDIAKGRICRDEGFKTIVDMLEDSSFTKRAS